MIDKERVREAFAKRLRLALKEAGYDVYQQKEIGELFGVSGQAARKWCDGTALPASTRMKEVADILGVERAWLQDGEGPMRAVAGRVKKSGTTPPIEDMVISSEEAEFVTLFRTLTVKQKKALWSVAVLFDKDR